MYGPEGNNFVFPRVLMFPESKSRKPQGKTKLTSFPRDPTLSVLLYI